MQSELVVEDVIRERSTKVCCCLNSKICYLLWRFYEEKWALKSVYLSTGVQGEVLESLQASRCIVHNIFL